MWFVLIYVAKVFKLFNYKDIHHVCSYVLRACQQYGHASVVLNENIYSSGNRPTCSKYSTGILQPIRTQISNQ